MADFKIASPEDFSPNTEVVQLPSQKGTDLGVVLRRPDPLRLLQSSRDNQIPDFLTNIVVAGLEGKTVSAEFDPTDVNVLVQLLELTDMVAITCFENPSVVRDEKYVEGSGNLPLSRLTSDDKQFVLSWALGVEFNTLENFRPGQEPTNVNVDDVPEGENVQPETK